MTAIAQPSALLPCLFCALEVERHPYSLPKENPQPRVGLIAVRGHNVAMIGASVGSEPPGSRSRSSSTRLTALFQLGALRCKCNVSNRD